MFTPVSLLTPPFSVRLADPGMSFYDPLSKLCLNGAAVKKVTVITPYTGEWLRAGGLIVVAETAASPSAPAGSSATNATENAPASSTESKPAAESSSAAPSLEDLLNKAESDLAGDVAAISAAKATTAASKTK